MFACKHESRLVILLVSQETQLGGATARTLRFAGDGCPDFEEHLELG